MSATGTQTDDVIGPVILLARATRVVAMYRGSTDQSTQTQLRWLRSAGRWQLGDDSEESEEDGDESATDSEGETPSDPWTVVDFCNIGPWTVVDFCNTENVVRIAY